MTEVRIVVDNGLPERSGRISRRTYDAVKKAKGSGAFFPDVSCFAVGRNPFDPDYIMFVVDDELLGGMFVISRDVKELFYKDMETLSLV